MVAKRRAPASEALVGPAGRAARADQAEGRAVVVGIGIASEMGAEVRAADGPGAGLAGRQDGGKSRFSTTARSWTTRTSPGYGAAWTTGARSYRGGVRAIPPGFNAR